MSYDSDTDNSPYLGGDNGYDGGGGSPAPEHDGGGGDYSAPGDNEGGGDPAPQHNESEEQPPVYARKKALLIAITYEGGLNTLHDLENFKEFLMIRRGYTEDEITVLSEHENTPDHLKPYASNIHREMERFYEDQQNGDHYVFYFAGHAFQTPARSDAQEEDDMDENMAVLGDNGEALPEIEDREAPPTAYPSIIDNVSMRSIAV
ncbi:hypothetical protein DXG01_014983 [Tephrocybe rancida]|nr:hypothetical protein DXG01_014983 [Tephrocybe rancida]